MVALPLAGIAICCYGGVGRVYLHFGHVFVISVGLIVCSKSPEGYVCQTGNFSLRVGVEPITCIAPMQKNPSNNENNAWYGESYVTGTGYGQLFQWTGRNCGKVAKAHEVWYGMYSCQQWVLMFCIYLT